MLSVRYVRIVCRNLFCRRFIWFCVLPRDVELSLLVTSILTSVKKTFFSRRLSTLDSICLCPLLQVHWGQFCLPHSGFQKTCTIFISYPLCLRFISCLPNFVSRVLSFPPVCIFTLKGNKKKRMEERRITSVP